MFTFNIISWYSWLLLALGAIAAGVFFLTGIRPFLRVSGKCAEDARRQIPPELQPASVVVYAKNNEVEIRDFLDSVLNQEHPDYEVIIVNDASADRTPEIVEEYMNSHPNLYMTFAPAGSHNLSRRKLALTLGIKAAHYDVIVTTAANCRIPSARWLPLMCGSFNNDRNVLAIGYAAMDPSQCRGWGKWYREFDSLMDSVRILSHSISGNPYRGNGANLAFRRRCFFENNGYGSTNWMQHGEDDVFVCEIARMGESETVLSPGAQLKTGWGPIGKRIWTDTKERYDFTRRYLPRSPFLSAGTASASLWLTLGFCAASAATALPSLIPAIAGILLFLAVCGASIAVYRKAASSLSATRLWWSVIPFMLIRPVANLIYRERFRAHRSNNLTCGMNR